MKRVLLGLLVSTAVFADPPYPDATTEGYFIPSLGVYHKATFEPGKLEDCKDYVSPTYSSYQCKVKDASIKIEIDGKTHTVTFDGLSASENAGGPTYPATLSFYVSGAKYKSTLPDGTNVESNVYLSLIRKATSVDDLTGSLSVEGISAGGLALKWPGVVPPPAPTSAKGP